MVFVFAVVVFILLVAFITILRKAGGGSFPWIQFYTKGKESGFNFREINLLRKVAVESHLENPSSLFWSIKQLDRSIKGMVIKFRSEGREDVDTSIRFLAKLFDFRRRVEMNLPKYTMGLKTTRKLATHQRLKITLPGVGTYSAQIVENLRKYMAISYPEGPKMPPGYSWRGQRVSIYFWRADDAGYVFQTKILEDFFEQQYPILHIAHSDNLTRSQKRNSVRVDLNKPALLFPLGTIYDASEEIENSPGLRCRLVDLSEDGAAILIGGRAKVGLSVKFQFSLSSTTIVMNGVVRGVSYNQKKNQSILHIQAIPPLPRTRNHILSYVYNLFNEREQVKGFVRL
jgi:c-di-GMP-binding flagellar brake protein YcgR